MKLGTTLVIFLGTDLDCSHSMACSTCCIPLIFSNLSMHSMFYVLVPQVQDVYRLLVDSSPVLRRAAAGLVAGLLEELGQRAIGQVALLPEDSLRADATRTTTGRGVTEFMENQIMIITVTIPSHEQLDAATGSAPSMT